MQLSLKFNRSELDTVVQLPGRFSPQALGALAGAGVGEIVLSQLRTFVNVRTGKTRDTLAYRLSGTRIQWFGGTVAGFLIHGTPAHMITATRGKFLLLQDGVFVRAVRHPGTRSYPFHQEAWDASRDNVSGYLRARALELIRG